MSALFLPEISPVPIASKQVTIMQKKSLNHYTFIFGQEARRSLASKGQKSSRVEVVALLRGAFYLAVIIGGMGTVALADTTWLKTATDCQSFEKGVSAFYAELGKSKVLSDSQKAELREVLQEACGARFRECDFKICRGRSAEDAEDEVEAAIEEMPVKIETDPLVWLEGSPSCEQVLEQVNVRYVILGEADSFPEGKQDEIRKVLRASCSDKFKTCFFPYCVDEEEARKYPDKQYDPEVIAWFDRAADALFGDQRLVVLAGGKVSRRAALKRHKELLDELMHQRDEAIARARQAEEKSGASWQRFSIGSI